MEWKKLTSHKQTWGQMMIDDFIRYAALLFIFKKYFTHKTIRVTRFLKWDNTFLERSCD